MLEHREVVVVHLAVAYLPVGTKHHGVNCWVLGVSVVLMARAVRLRLGTMGPVHCAMDQEVVRQIGVLVVA